MSQNTLKNATRHIKERSFCMWSLSRKCTLTDAISTPYIKTAAFHCCCCSHGTSCMFECVPSYQVCVCVYKKVMSSRGRRIMTLFCSMNVHTQQRTQTTDWWRASRQIHTHTHTPMACTLLAHELLKLRTSSRVFVLLPPCCKSNQHTLTYIVIRTIDEMIPACHVCTCTSGRWSITLGRMTRYCRTWRECVKWRDTPQNSFPTGYQSKYTQPKNKICVLSMVYVRNYSEYIRL